MFISASFIMSCAVMLSMFVGRSSALLSKGILLRTAASRGQTFVTRGRQLDMAARSDLSKQQNQFLMRPMDDMLTNVMRLAFRPLLESTPSGSVPPGH
jgi:hypothetical protein